MRLTTLERWQDVEPLLDHVRAGESTEWGWRFYAALWRALLKADLAPFGAIRQECPDAASLVAAIAALVSIRFEDESVPLALSELSEALRHKDLRPVDRA